MEETELLADSVEASVFEDPFDKTLQGTSVNGWIDGISVEAAETISMSDEGDRDNLMFNPAFVEYFLDLCRLFPLWSAVCCQFFPNSESTASSGNVESHIKVMKQSMEDVIPCSVDKFVHENLDMVEGMIIEASQDYIQFISSTGAMEFDSTIEYGQTADTEENSLPNEVDESDGAIVVDVGPKQPSVQCPACKDENWPTGAHTCIGCGKNVHLLDGCSVSLGNSEGYGEKRMCADCENQRKIREHNKIAEMKHTEQWCRKSKREIKRSKYLVPVPNWTLNHHLDKNVKIGMLANGNMSTRVFGTKNDLTGLKNTCSFDVIAQV